jgi:hypothetical protein
MSKPHTRSLLGTSPALAAFARSSIRSLLTPDGARAGVLSALLTLFRRLPNLPLPILADVLAPKSLPSSAAILRFLSCLLPLVTGDAPACYLASDLLLIILTSAPPTPAVTVTQTALWSHLSHPDLLGTLKNLLAAATDPGRSAASVLPGLSALATLSAESGTAAQLLGLVADGGKRIRDVVDASRGAGGAGGAEGAEGGGRKMETVPVLPEYG